ncbi:hypothetical protein DGMP_15630 [Desulfomarina profundi]|uniref:Lipopolysaccharide-assembly n=1 Tax=Desulfomarina profundi TaxID=2772557 RepID=A0A8D5FNI1_9BACT|nr:LptE family protein [Desulfomarina profundi]BCL60870.1 hypothetical protein DGMP_15630 [Desulfomarina profundi]
MKPVYRFLPVLFIVTFLMVSCGYHNPNIYTGPARSIYITEWKNRTNVMDLHSKIYRSLTKWFQKSSSISIVNSKKNADLILAGEIVSIDLPSLSYGIDSTTNEVKVRLRIRYILKEIATNKILLEIPNEVWTQEYLSGTSSSENADNETEALNIIIEDLAQKIYRNSISGLPQL